MIGVGQDNPGVEFTAEVPLRDGLHARLCADGHEHRSFDHAMPGVKQPSARPRHRAFRLNFEAQIQLSGGAANKRK